MAATKHVLVDGDISRPLKKSRVGAAMDTTADKQMCPERKKRKKGEKVKEARLKEKVDFEAVSKASSPINYPDKSQMSEVRSNHRDHESGVMQEKAAKKKREKGEKEMKAEKKEKNKKMKKKRKETTEEPDDQVCRGTEAKSEKGERTAHKKAKKDVKRSNRLPRVDLGSPDGAVSSSIEELVSKNKKAREVDSRSRLDAELTTRNYIQTISLSNVPKADIDTYISTHQIVITDPRTTNLTLRPVTEFYHLPSTNLLEKKPSPFANYQAPTPIQAASWPFTLSGRDVVGVAETGSGKTMAFALPCVESISTISHKGIKAVIVSPTRELAMQTHAQLEQLASLVKLNSVCLYGGSSKDDQRLRLQRGCDIVVATPGRLKDFMSDGTVELSRAVFVVLDEADRMLDKGFEDDIKQILGSCPAREKRQTLMFTATWPQSVQALASTFMTDPVKISIGVGGKDTENGAVELQANIRITQQVEVVDPRDKEFRLLQILKQHQQGKQKNDRILVFCLYKKEATRVENLLSRKGLRVCGIHGDLRQEQRTRSLEAFKSGITPILVATDVAARGLDIPEVKLVVNVTFPLTIEDYVHRIGRTGRAGNFGEAITFFTVQDKAHSGSLINILKGANQSVPDDLLRFGTTVKKKTHEMYGSFFKEVDMSQKATKITFD